METVKQVEAMQRTSVETVKEPKKLLETEERKKNERLTLVLEQMKAFIAAFKSATVRTPDHLELIAVELEQSETPAELKKGNSVIMRPWEK